MAEFNQKIKLYLGRNYTDKEILLRDDGNGPYVDFWLDSLEKPKPTEEQLNALESEANAIEANNQVIANRISEYPTIEELVVALYDTDDKAAIDSKRAEIKLKYPKPVA